MDDRLSDYYESNIELLKKHHPETWKQLQEDKPEPFGNVFSSPTGKPNLIAMNDQGHSILVHNEKAPEKDATLFTSRIPDSHQGFVGILGMGLGYGILNILRKKPLVQKLAIFELEPGIFVQALRYMDLSDLLADPRVIFRIGRKTPISLALASAQNTLKLEDASILQHPASINIIPNDYQDLKKDVFKFINLLNVEGTTTKKLGRQFTINRLKHVSTIRHHRILGQMRNIFQKKPAVLVAGGPSLDKNIHLLKNIQENAIIIAVDTVYPTLLKHGINPHFITTIDPSNVTFEKLADVVSEKSNTSLICIPSANLKTAKIFPARQVFWAFTIKPIEKWLNRLLGGNVETTGASTVAHLNFIAAVLFGCDPVVFVGQDLAYPGKASHAKGTVLHGTAPSQKIGQGWEETMTMGVDGKMVRTDRGFLSMKSHFEALIKTTPITCINATEGGAHIEGTEVKTLKEVIETVCNKNLNITQLLENHYQTLVPPAIENLALEFNKFLKTVKTVFQKIKQADSVTISLLKTLKKQKKTKKKIQSFNMLSPSQQKQIRKIDKLHADLDNMKMIWSFVEEITMEGLKESERKKLEIASLESNPSRYIDWLIKNLERLIGINEVRKETASLLAENLEMILDFQTRENKFLETGETSLDLARLYVETDNYRLAKPVLKNLCKTMPDSGVVQYLTGCTALQFNELDLAEKHFKAALSLDPGFDSKINAFRQQLGDEFLSFAEHFKKLPNRDASIKYSLKKGLRLCPLHPGLRTELEQMIRKDLRQINTLIEQKKWPEAQPLINEWHDWVSDNPDRPEYLSDEFASKIFLNHGQLQLSQKDYPKAIQSLESALALAPEDRDLYFLTIDACFVSGDFNKGIEILNRAVLVDVQFAGYWETIGDQLKEGGQNEDAITAYERCISYLPEKINVIKKIGDCYLELGLLDEAKTAYELMKKKTG